MILFCGDCLSFWSKPTYLLSEFLNQNDYLNSIGNHVLKLQGGGGYVIVFQRWGEIHGEIAYCVTCSKESVYLIYCCFAFLIEFLSKIFVSENESTSCAWSSVSVSSTSIMAQRGLNLCSQVDQFVTKSFLCSRTTSCSRRNCKSAFFLII